MASKTHTKKAKLNKKEHTPRNVHCLKHLFIIQ
jgi:hypothetical protein